MFELLYFGCLEVPPNDAQPISAATRISPPAFTTYRNKNYGRPHSIHETCYSLAVRGDTTGAAAVTVRVTFTAAGVPAAGEAPVNVMVPV